MASTIEVHITRNLESAIQSLTESYLYTIKSIVNILKYVIDGPVSHWNFNSTGDNLTYQIFRYGMISPSFVTWSMLRPAAFRDETMKYHRPLYIPVEIQTRERYPCKCQHLNGTNIVTTRDMRFIFKDVKSWFVCEINIFLLNLSVHFENICLICICKWYRRRS